MYTVSVVFAYNGDVILECGVNCKLWYGLWIVIFAHNGDGIEVCGVRCDLWYVVGPNRDGIESFPP